MQICMHCNLGKHSLEYLCQENRKPHPAKRSFLDLGPPNKSNDQMRRFSTVFWKHNKEHCSTS